ncbi:MAG: hypothetical protein QOJ57_447, partial [Thermoleophilaceae bacterium]|nr:hypothetical protein [Thermoleophilaceae bacterium]
MCHPRVVLTIAGLLSAFGLSGCLPQFGCGRDEHVELRGLIYRCVDDISYDDSYDYVVGTAPTTSIAVSRNPAQEGQQVSIYAIDEDIDGDVVDHSWDLDGDGSFETDTGQGTRASRSYPPGTYELMLRVTDGDGNVAGASKTLDVEAGGGGVSPGGNSHPTASFTFTPSPGRAGESVHFDGSGSEDSDGSVVSYQWDFENDGQFDTQPDASPIATHVYPTPGQKT